ncbi:MAG: hypothetical protein COV07_01570 [Candidatus Vogelbacteria bacterium CG10_big_fil_rev_8_21_14_0_10_45_14]|uniref:Uncharacterized protein n=1 Tax=Candidatus Vogelbacteria bacterium CG10_big_fil_rev_8_21_14_0_10_45_14 TaxID=1975042 RepID=A0A2H0RK99_9BACT|nr:MAG: hypothetical protein COV07_01570 [Candidatus Vogelbacteria bacterium CG10_big_fil_rev_8_21_14_0_10_45_14]
MSKTPLFDVALDEYFKALTLDEKGGVVKTCRVSGKDFYVHPKDVNFCKKIRVPLPSVSPEERFRLMLSFENSYNLFADKSSLSGKPIISIHPHGHKYPVYEHTEWHSDKWDRHSFEKDYKEGVPFLAQFKEMIEVMPRPNLISDTSNANSEYTNESFHLRNSYLTFYSFNSDNILYADGAFNSRDCMDGFSFWNCDSCYTLKQVGDSWKAFFVEDSINIRESYFLYDCRSSKNCFMSSNLRNKEYVFRNEQLTKAEYEEKIKSVNLGNYVELEKYKEEFIELKRSAARRPAIIDRSVNCDGHYIDNSKDCHKAMWMGDCENVDYSMSCMNFKDCQFVLGGNDGSGSQLDYLTCFSFGTNYGVRFSIFAKDCRNLEYCDSLRNSSDCFGCFGLTNAKYCILNKEYSEVDYLKTLDRIKTGMLKEGTYGEFFPANISPYPYNITLAIAYPGFDDAEVARGYGYRVEKIETGDTGVGANVLKAEDVPLDVKDVNDDVSKAVIEDKGNGKHFRIIPRELEFYKKNNIALPRKGPLRRLEDWRTDEGNISLDMTIYKRDCSKCGVEITTLYRPDQFQDTVYCDRCYNESLK